MSRVRRTARTVKVALIVLTASAVVQALVGAVATDVARADDTTSFAFGYIQVGQTSNWLAGQVYTSAGKTLTIRQIANSNPQVFKLSSHSGCIVGTTITPTGKFCALRYTATPPAAQSYTATITVTFTDSTPALSFSASVTGANPHVTPSATSLDFGTITLNTKSATQVVTLTNDGQVPATFSSATWTNSRFNQQIPPNGIAACTQGVVVAVGGSCALAFSVTPDTAGTLTATVEASFTGADDVTVALTAAGSPIAVSNPNALAFGKVATQTWSTPRSVTFTNIGTTAVTISARTGANSPGVFVWDDTGAGDCQPSLTLKSNASCVLRVQANPTIASNFKSVLRLSLTNLPDTTVQMTVTGASAASISISSTANSGFAFGKVTAKVASPTQSVVITNTSATTSVTLGAPSSGVTGAFAVDTGGSNSCAAQTVLAAGASCVLSAHATPPSVGSFVDVITVPVVNFADIGIPSSVTGVSASSPITLYPGSAVYTFGSVARGTTSIYQMLTITNSGTSTVTFTGITGVGGAFAIIGDGCLPDEVLDPDYSCTIAVQVDPTKVGPFTGVLRVTLAGGLPDVAVPMSVTGT